jgi:hypothetical protein
MQFELASGLAVTELLTISTPCNTLGQIQQHPASCLSSSGQLLGSVKSGHCGAARHRHEDGPQTPLQLQGRACSEFGLSAWREKCLHSLLYPPQCAEGAVRLPAVSPVGPCHQLDQTVRACLGHLATTHSPDNQRSRHHQAACPFRVTLVTIKLLVPFELGSCTSPRTVAWGSTASCSLYRGLRCCIRLDSRLGGSY